MTYLAIENCRSVREAAAAMREARACSVCPKKFAVSEEGLCRDCMEHFFGDKVDGRIDAKLRTA